MSIVSCPRCGDKVSVPPAASPGALVQCPLCCEEYFLSDALIQLPPMLRVVGGHAAAAEKEGEYHLAEPVTAAIAGAEFDTSGAAAATVSPRPQLRTVSRPRRQERSAVGEIIKVVLGGAAGLMGGLLVLWWGFGVDVGELAPKVAKVQYLRFLVPPKLRSQTPPDIEPKQLDTISADPKQGKGSGGEARTNGGIGQGAEQSAAADGNKKSRPTSIEEESQGKPVKGKGKNGKKQPEDDPFAELDVPVAKPSPGESPELKIDDPLSAIKSKQDDNKQKEKEPPPANKGGSGVFGEGIPPTQAALARRLAQAVEAVSGSIDALETVNRDDLEAVDAALKYVYDTAARLTTAVLDMDRSAAEFKAQRPALDDSLRRLARDSRRTDVIRQRARIKLDDAGSSGSWILLAGTVKAVRPAGDWFETTVEATDDKRFTAVLTAEEPQDSWKVGDQVIVLGRVVHDPSDNAKGYEGDAEIAVTATHGVRTGDGAPAEDTKTERKATSESSLDRQNQPAAEKPKPAAPKPDEPKSNEDKPAEKDAE